MVEAVLRQRDLDGGVIRAVRVAPKSGGDGDSTVADQHDVGALVQADEGVATAVCS